MSLLAKLGLAKGKNFEVGQVWSYKTRVGEEASTILVNRVEIHPELGSIFHISILNIRIKNPRASTGVTTEMTHSPVSRRTLEESCTKLVARGRSDPGYLDGYDEWKRSFDQGDAGVFTITVAEIIDGIETAINK